MPDVAFGLRTDCVAEEVGTARSTSDQRGAGPGVFCIHQRPGECRSPSSPLTRQRVDIEGTRAAASARLGGRPGARSAEREALAGAGRGGIGQRGHAERVPQAREPGEDRDDEGDLQGDGPGLVLIRRISSCTSAGWSTSNSSRPVLLSSCASVVQHLGDLLLLADDRTSLLSASRVNRVDSAASMIAPAKASPKDSPKDPAAEFTPAASLTRSSAIGLSV